MVRSGDAPLALRANWQAQMRRGHNIRRDIELPSYEAIPIRVTAESAFQMFVVANEDKARLARLCSCRKGTAKQVGARIFDGVLTILPLE
jgi:hypothetical protein